MFSKSGLSYCCASEETGTQFFLLVEGSVVVLKDGKVRREISDTPLCCCYTCRWSKSVISSFVCSDLAFAARGDKKFERPGMVQ